MGDTGNITRTTSFMVGTRRWAGSEKRRRRVTYTYNIGFLKKMRHEHLKATFLNVCPIFTIR